MIREVFHALVHRVDVRAWLVAAALGCLSLSASAVNKGNIGRAGVTSNGRSATIGPVTNSGGSTIPVSPTVGGWSQAGNYGVPPAATGPTMQRYADGTVGFSGVRYPFQAGYQQPKYEWVLPALGAAAAIGCTFASGGLATVACLGLPAAMPYLYDWITRSGGRLNPQTGGLERQVDGGYNWLVSGSGCIGTDEYVVAVCAARFFAPNAGEPTGCYLAEVASPTQHVWRCPGVWAGTLSRGQAQPSSWLPSSMDDIAPYMRNVEPSPRVWGEAMEKGATFPDPTPTVTGPTQIQGPEKSTTNPDGSRTVERTTYNFNTSGPTITNTTNTTTTTTYNTDNSVRNTSTTTTTPTAETMDPNDPCEKKPNSVGCQELDEPPKGEVPRENKTITYSEESVFGGGSCPSDKQWSSVVTGHSYKVVDWQTFCGYALPVRFLVILLATFAAFLIVMPGKEVRT